MTRQALEIHQGFWVYNILNFEQVVDYSLTNKIPLIVEKCDKGFFDPLRDRACGFSNSENLAKENILKHRTISKEIFENSVEYNFMHFKEEGHKILVDTLVKYLD